MLAVQCQTESTSSVAVLADRAVPGRRAGAVVPFPADHEQRHLLRRIATGDSEAMRRFYQLYHGRLARFLRPIAYRADLVDEIVNDTLHHVWRSAGRFRGESRVSSWVLGIARRQGLRRSQREWQKDAHFTRGLDVEPTVEDEIELGDWLHHALAALPDEQRTAIELAYVGGYTCEEIGAVLCCPVNTVKTRLYQARTKLRAAFAAADAGRSIAGTGAPARTAGLEHRASASCD